MITLTALTGDYTLDQARTRIGFLARHTIGPAVPGRFDRFAGSAHLDGDDPARSSAELTIQAAGIDTRNAQRDGYLRGKYLNAAAHPAITFTSTGVRQAGQTTFDLTGDLTIRGVTRPITVTLELTGADDTRVTLTGGATLNRKDWGVHWAAAAGLVATSVRLDLDLVATRRDPS
ncbi:YceI family protein [Nonomuraea sp. NBC_01738]|uniref:YceI family protein n=1 Tax=Nonomuraea sp. NBC_01738 TaxID=2976003 RepID=UPI002E144DC5|nr:YceI family protein [Nonomuraea sp. NBC_01738]